MNKSVLEELCKEEDELVERLRVLREFKEKFFSPSQVKFDPLPFNKTIVEEPKAELKKNAVKRHTKRSEKSSPMKKVTVAQRVLRALGELGRGQSKDVAAKLLELYPNEYKVASKATGDARYQLSDLKKLNKIVVDEPGLGNSGDYYKLNDGVDDIL